MVLSANPKGVCSEICFFEEAVAGDSAEASALWVSEGDGRAEGARVAGKQEGCSEVAKGLGIAAFAQDQAPSTQWHPAGSDADGRQNQSSAATANDPAFAFAVHGFHGTFV